MQSTAIIEGRGIAWAAAAFSAGPIYTCLVMGAALVRANAALPAALLFLLPIAIIFGLVLAGPLIGALIWLGGWLGTRWAVWRNPAIWGVIGAAGGAAAGPALDVTRLGNPGSGALAGGLVALIARRLIRWRKPAVL